MSFLYLCYVFHTLLLQQFLIKPLVLLGSHPRLIFCEQAHFLCFRPVAMGQRTENKTGTRTLQRNSNVKKYFVSKNGSKVERVTQSQSWGSSHSNGLRLFGNLPQGQEQADLLGVVQKQLLSGGFGFKESLQGLNGLFHLKDALNLVKIK